MRKLGKGLGGEGFYPTAGGGSPGSPQSESLPPKQPLLIGPPSSSATCHGPHILRGALETGPVDANTRTLRHRKRGLTFTVITTGLLTETKEEQILDF